MKKKISIVLAGILFLAGLSLLLYPLVANQWNNYRQSRLISEYESVVKDESRKGTINYEKEWERADAYNQSLLPSILPILSQSQQHPISPVRIYVLSE